MVDSVSVPFKNLACRKSAFKHIRIQWNAGTACVSECVLKTLACRGFRVGPSKSKTKTATTQGNLNGSRFNSSTKNQPKEEVLGTDIPRTSGGHSRGYPGPKLRSGRSRSWKKQAFGRRHPWPEVADVHDRKGLPKTSVRKTSGWIFVPYKWQQADGAKKCENGRPNPPPVSFPRFQNFTTLNFWGPLSCKIFRALFPGQRRAFRNALFPGKQSPPECHQRSLPAVFHCRHPRQIPIKTFTEF